MRVGETLAGCIFTIFRAFLMTKIPESQPAEENNNAPNFKTGTIWHSDNLELMQGMNSETVDFIYLDPPFNSAKNYKGTGKANKQGFADNWSEKQLKEWDMLKGVQDNVDLLRTQEWWSLMELVKDKHSESMYYYLSFMAVRILQMKRIMKPTASIYLHCDPTSNSYLRMLMDYIFGKDYMQNEIVWYYKNASRGKRRLAKAHDTIYWYSKSDNYCFNRDNILVPFESGMTEWRYKRGGQAGQLAPKGKTPDDIITMPSLNTMSKERTGWATQKPLALLEQLLLAGSNKGDLVFDPFCGCATTLIAAATNDRKFIGCDVDEEVVEITKMRWQDSADLFHESTDPEVAESIHISKEIPIRTDKTEINEPPSKLTSTDVRRLYGKTLYGKQEGYCRGCKEHEKFKNMDVDHIFPRSRGGTNDIENLQLLCRQCNVSKGDKTMEEWKNPTLSTLP